ncbi:phospholipase A2 inhibitor subunit gamma B-like [Rana temporaria]|uniref:phospholipase A2 inhibitor subunit gamma B-like n=1 Tax=Rana temporaria TaxID=8407 RepID=UPI001AAC993D|nr:phospholipase A2 inhibitor subunit gamma B-like [Rana temporaria]
MCLFFLFAVGHRESSYLMMCLLEFFIILAALASTAQSLTCTDCFNVGSSSCTSLQSKVCPSGYVCASQYAVTVMGSTVVEQFNRSCSPQAQCAVTGSYTGTLSADRIAITCCNTDLCTPATPQVLNTDSQPNGLWCQQCLSADATPCTGNLVQCSGERNLCLQKSVKSTSGSETVYKSERGCASKGYCNMETGTVVYGGVTQETTYICTNAAPTKNNAATITATATPILFLFVILTIAF